MTGFGPDTYKTLTIQQLDDFYEEGKRLKGLK